MAEITANKNLSKAPEQTRAFKSPAACQGDHGEARHLCSPIPPRGFDKHTVSHMIAGCKISPLPLLRWLPKWVLKEVLWVQIRVLISRMAHGKPHGKPHGIAREWDPAVTLLFPARLQLPRGLGTGLTRREKAASSHPRHRGGSVARSPAMLPGGWQHFAAPGPCWQYCVTAVWWCGIQRCCPMELSRREAQEGRWCLHRGGGRWAVSRLCSSSLPSPVKHCTNSKGHKIWDEQDKISYLLPWARSFPMVSFQVPFALSLLLNDAWDVASSSSWRERERKLYHNAIDIPHLKLLLCLKYHWIAALL